MEKSRSEKLSSILTESSDIDEGKLKIIEHIESEVEKSEDILSARIYGSWLYPEKSIDLDICIMVPNDNGVVDPIVYQRLKDVRARLSENSTHDVDLVPHTSDEITDFRSGLYNPRYNPSLIHGLDVKGKIEINPISDKNEHFTYSDLVAGILLDNRTVCRRQIIRSMNASEGKVFASKILHGPGNALTYHACRQKTPYLVSPSNLTKSLELFDRVYSVDSSPAKEFLQSCKNGLNAKEASLLLEWYERFVSLVLYGQKGKNYKNFCLKMSHFNSNK